MKPLAPNSMIQNRYLVVHAIGKGGMGEVYLAVDQRLGSAVALKRTFFQDDNVLGSAFEREARILARLRHAVLPKVIDHFAENGDQFLVMEHISGDDLSARLEASNKPFPVTWVMFWADQLLDALNYLHSHEPPIIHRDIKPQNLKLTDNNHIVLLDFGLSKDFDSKSAANPMNSASVAGYSPHFASMEQIRGTGTDARSDLYSLSATLYQLLTNKIPSDALTRADALLGGRPDPIVSPSDFNPEVSKAISEVILKGIALRQEERFHSAADMQKALRKAYNAAKTSGPPQPSSTDTTINKAPDTKPPVAPTPDKEIATRLKEPEPVAQAPIDPIDPDATLQMDMAAVMQHVQSEPERSAVEPAPQKTEELPKAAAAAVGKPVSFAAQTHEPAKEEPAKASAAAKQGSKAGLMIGLLLGLVILGGAAGGGVWYFYKNSAKASTPTPTPVQTKLPQTESTPVAANSTQTSTVPDATPSGANTAIETGNTQTGPTKPVPAGQKPSTPKPSGQGAKPPAPKKDDRTVILQ